jgi:hypothetical protein
MHGTRSPAKRWTGLAVGLLLSVGALAVVQEPPAHANGGEGYLEVTVQGPDGSPLGSAVVILYEAGQVNPDPVNDPGWRPAELAQTGTGADGVAHFAQTMPPDRAQISVKIWVDAVGFVGEWYLGETYTDAVSASIGEGLTESKTVALSGVLRVINVYVYDDSDSDVALGGTTVGLYDDADGSTAALTSTTRSDGVAQLKVPLGLAPGTYHVKGTRPGYITQWYLGEPAVGTNDFESAFDVDLSTESFALNYNLAMTAGTPAAFTKAPRPTISGTVKRGRTLTAKTGTWVPKPTFRFRWYRGTKPITGATAKTYTLRKADVGKRMSVRIRGSALGYVTTSRTSARTTVVKP